MIERIELASCASYGQTPEVMDDFVAVNFVYGPNGAGKTTISRLIHDESKHPSCTMRWKNNSKLETVVYNRDFVDRNFTQSGDLKGIFTLGEKDVAAQAKIALLKQETEDLDAEVVKFTETLQGSDGLSGKRGELSKVESDFRDECWKVKTKHDAKLSGAMTGVRDAKQKFRDRLVQECGKPAATPKTLNDLETRAASVFGPAPTPETAHVQLDDASFLTWEKAAILKKRVIGKTDVDIADMIHKLGNSDWVKQGIPYFEAADGSCPFCQQPAPKSLKQSLEDYFDKAFTEDAAKIEALRAGYKLEGERLQTAMKSAIDSGTRLDIEKLKAEKAIFDSRFQLNVQRIESKVKEPSQLVELEPLDSVLSTAKKLIADSNQAIGAHNTMVANLATEKATLTREVWEYFANAEILVEYKAYDAEKTNKLKAIEALDTKIADCKTAKAAKEAEIRKLEKATTSIQPTINEINKILGAFGFHNFSLEATAGNLYRIRRSDGTAAKETLSEGERSFISFLYFYHLLKGSNSESGTTNDRIVVFDDPVSSLDSDVLFVVSNLIRQVIEEVRKDIGHIKQVFVLTHNVYFHKEVAFKAHGKGGGPETFWTIRKINGVSIVRKHKENPIASSYALLWAEVKEPNLKSQGLPNTLRRILEHYFKVLGGYPFDEIIDMFDGEEKLMCRSLLTWVHDGSHSVPDDIFVVALDEEAIAKYLEVFKNVFIKTKHASHYNMMMGAPLVIETTVVSA